MRIHFSHKRFLFPLYPIYFLIKYLLSVQKRGTQSDVDLGTPLMESIALRAFAQTTFI